MHTVFTTLNMKNLALQIYHKATLIEFSALFAGGRVNSNIEGKGLMEQYFINVKDPPNKKPIILDNIFKLRSCVK